MKITLTPRAALVAICLALAGCKTVPINTQTIRGHYEMMGKPEGLWYTGESLELGDGTFSYSLFTELSDDARAQRYPVTGRYTLEGATISLHNPAVLFPQRSITRLHKQFLLWTPKQREFYRETKRIPDDCLLQGK
jgi:hypothetical protein